MTVIEELLKPKKKPVDIKPRKIIKTDDNGTVVAIINIDAPAGMFSVDVDKNTFDVSNNPTKDKIEVRSYEVKNGSINKIDKSKKPIDELA